MTHINHPTQRYSDNTESNCNLPWQYFAENSQHVRAEHETGNIAHKRFSARAGMSLSNILHRYSTAIFNWDPFRRKRVAVIQILIHGVFFLFFYYFPSLVHLRYKVGFCPMHPSQFILTWASPSFKPRLIMPYLFRFVHVAHKTEQTLPAVINHILPFICFAISASQVSTTLSPRSQSVWHCVKFTLRATQITISHVAWHTVPEIDHRIQSPCRHATCCWCKRIHIGVRQHSITHLQRWRLMLVVYQTHISSSLALLQVAAPSPAVLTI